MARAALTSLGSHPVAVWLVKHVVSPLDRWVLRLSGGRLRPPSSLVVPTVLLTTVGRKSGQVRTTPLVYITDGDRFIVANARPDGERRNPWVLNLRDAGEGVVRRGRETAPVRAWELDDIEAEQWWPLFVERWPAFGEHYAATGERTVFVLEPWLSGRSVD